jgi:hypothetical protein
VVLGMAAGIFAEGRPTKRLKKYVLVPIATPTPTHYSFYKNFSIKRGDFSAEIILFVFCPPCKKTIPDNDN